MKNTIYLETTNPVLEKELFSLLTDFTISTFSLNQDEKGILSCPSPRLWMIEVNPNDLKTILFIKEIVEVRQEPVIILSRENAGLVMEECFAIGVDDFIQQPWYPAVIKLRIDAVLRRRGFDQRNTDNINWKYDDNSLSLDQLNHKLSVNEQSIDLTPSQWNLFHTLIANGNRVVSREYLLDECLSQSHKKTRTLDNHMKNLRNRLTCPEIIDTVRGYGYRLKGEAC